MAAQFATATTGVVKMPVNVTADGNIAQENDTVTGNKQFSIQGIKADATLAQANAVFDAFIGGIAGGSYDSLGATKTITVGVVEA